MEKFLSILYDTFKSALHASITEYGPGVVLLIIGFCIIMILHERLWLARVKDKNQEIHRIAMERDKLQDHILEKHLESAELTEEGDPRA